MNLPFKPEDVSRLLTAKPYEVSLVIPHLRVLAVVPDQQLSEKLEGLLARRSIEINRVHSGTGALILTGNLRHDVIVVEEPLSDLPLGEFLNSLRTLESTCANSVVLVMANDEDVGKLVKKLDGELTQVISKGAEESSIQIALSSLLGVAARLNTRMKVQLEVGLGEGNASRIFDSQNVSETGMLLRGGRAIPVGSPVRFEFSLPDELEPILGTAVVVRHATEKENSLGIALQFVDLSRDATKRLSSYVEQRTTSRPVTEPGTDSTPIEHPAGT
jgi:DNA-binding NarL/FixJ family response regulator